MNEHRIRIRIVLPAAAAVLAAAGLVTACAASSASAAPSSPPSLKQEQNWSGWTNTIPPAPGYDDGAYTGSFCYDDAYMIALQSGAGAITVTATGQSC